MPATKLSSQLVGAYGEKVVEAALLRLGWMPSNINATVKNAKRFDILAQAPDWKRAVPIRVKTCGPDQEAFQYNFKVGPVPMDDLNDIDVTVLVAMGKVAAGDRFYVVPTRIVRLALEAARVAFYSVPRRDGGKRVETTQITLWLRPLRRGKDDNQHGFAQRWECYRDGWGLLSADSI